MATAYRYQFMRPESGGATKKAADQAKVTRQDAQKYDQTLTAEASSARIFGGFAHIELTEGERQDALTRFGANSMPSGRADLPE